MHFDVYGQSLTLISPNAAILSRHESHFSTSTFQRLSHLTLCHGFWKEKSAGSGLESLAYEIDLDQLQPLQTDFFICKPGWSTSAARQQLDMQQPCPVAESPCPAEYMSARLSLPCPRTIPRLRSILSKNIPEFPMVSLVRHLCGH